MIRADDCEKEIYSNDVDAPPQGVQHFRTRRADRRHRQHAKDQRYKLGSRPAPTIVVSVSSTHRQSHVGIPPRPRSTELCRQLLEHVLDGFRCVQLPWHAPHAVMAYRPTHGMLTEPQRAFERLVRLLGGRHVRLGRLG